MPRSLHLIFSFGRHVHTFSPNFTTLFKSVDVKNLYLCIVLQLRRDIVHGSLRSPFSFARRYRDVVYIAIINKYSVFVYFYSLSARVAKILFSFLFFYEGTRRIGEILLTGCSRISSKLSTINFKKGYKLL